MPREVQFNGSAETLILDKHELHIQRHRSVPVPSCSAVPSLWLGRHWSADCVMPTQDIAYIFKIFFFLPRTKYYCSYTLRSRPADHILFNQALYWNTKVTDAVNFLSALMTLAKVQTFQVLLLLYKNNSEYFYSVLKLNSVSRPVFNSRPEREPCYQGGIIISLNTLHNAEFTFILYKLQLAKWAHGNQLLQDS